MTVFLFLFFLEKVWRHLCTKHIAKMLIPIQVHGIPFSTLTASFENMGKSTLKLNGEFQVAHRIQNNLEKEKPILAWKKEHLFYLSSRNFKSTKSCGSAHRAIEINVKDQDTKAHQHGPPADVSHLKGPMTSQDSTATWGLSVPTHEPVRDISHSSHNRGLMLPMQNFHQRCNKQNKAVLTQG